MSTPNHPLWADTAHVPLYTTPSRGLYPPSAYPYPAYLEAPWDHVSTHASGIVPQFMGGLTSAPVPLDAATGQYGGHDHAIVSSSAAGWMHPIDAAWLARQGLGALLVHPPEQGISGNTAPTIPHTIGTPARTTQDASVEATVPVVIRHTIGTPAMVSSADRRRVRPRKHGCHICSSMFTSKENRDREDPFVPSSRPYKLTVQAGHVRAHYGIKPFICLCGVAFTTKVDLSRHRKGGRCPLAARIE
ncbi:hypothetical protein PC9H_010529 [Pleurotus ostreatus]|uniref:C2H2-type domain-containing protein n=1 Tax=Pleurotus ostreatus TaxID=5322 RepID=A0A8H6ZNX4_PLEOS|nr:uncharacterized protein PC9H_010529 [Pleurotus ostreatus]KAF7422373.1 hypothetical protein PC9H_010529 [Pleurotus ostreatus]